MPGDFVNLLVTVSDAAAAAEGGGGESSGAVFSQPARVLFQKVQILAVGQTRKLEPGETAETNADGTPAAAASSGLITFVVPAAAAQQIASVEGAQLLPDPRGQGLPADGPRAARHGRRPPGRDRLPAHPLRPRRTA